MPRVELTERFVEDASSIRSERLLSHVYTALRNLESFPQMGSTDVPQSIVQEFGEGVRKYVVAPFDLVYEYDDASDIVYVYGLVPCVQAR